jgi:crotonobetainyl-CoA:carnitine CoA-transferase CaiB-like acyl-CoA transferase
MSQRQLLRVVELAETVSAAVCGRMFAALGHDVLLCEPPSGHPLRAREFTFAALNSGKRSAVIDPCADRAGWQTLLSTADVLIIGRTPAAAAAVHLTPRELREQFPNLVTVSLTAFGLTGDNCEIIGDSLLAEAYGGLATMIGEPDRQPLSLGGEQAAHAAALVGFYGAMLALARSANTGLGDFVEVALSDVAAYIDWKTDVSYSLGGAAPMRSGVSRGMWRVVPAADGWVGVIFTVNQWPAVVELIGDRRLADPELLDPVQLATRAEQWWPIVAQAIAEREATEVYTEAQRLGLPFGYACTAADLLVCEQFESRDFVVPAAERRRDAPVVRLPFPHAKDDGVHAPQLGAHEAAFANASPPCVSIENRSAETKADAPLRGIVVLDFGTITAGAATGRLLADYGATVIKIESHERPDGFRAWGTGVGGASATTSPLFDSNNVGKHGLSLDLMTAEGRRLAQHLISRADVVVENFRVGVTERMGIDVETALRLNPELIYLSLSSQGYEGPESKYCSYGSTLDLLSGLAAVTGYRDRTPMWSSAAVNYPDQLVSLLGAGLVAHCLVTAKRGRHLDVSQREGRCVDVG